MIQAISLYIKSIHPLTTQNICIFHLRDYTFLKPSEPVSEET